MINDLIHFKNMWCWVSKIMHENIHINAPKTFVGFVCNNILVLMRFFWLLGYEDICFYYKDCFIYLASFLVFMSKNCCTFLQKRTFPLQTIAKYKNCIMFSYSNIVES